MRNLLPTVDKALVVAVVSVATTVLAMLTFVAVRNTWHGERLAIIEMDFVWGLSVFAGLAFVPIWLWGLLRTSLQRSLPIVVGTALGASAAFAPLGVGGAGLALASPVVAIVLCRYTCRAKVPTP